MVVIKKTKNLHLTTSEEHIIQTKNLSIGYKSKKDVAIIQDNINLKIKKGTLVTILGKNGAGKSTLLRTLLSLQPSISGETLLEKKVLSKYSDEQLASKISVVLTEKLPDSQLTVYELVALGRQPYTNWLGSLSENDKEQIKTALEQTETAHLANKQFYELSDGQLQRVLIAKALAQNTEIIILDEPTAHLDLHHTVKIFQLLRKLVNETQKTVIISSHEVNFSIKTSNQLILLTDSGVKTGLPKDLINQKAFDDLFPQEMIKFSTTLEQFVISQNL